MREVFIVLLFYLGGNLPAAYKIYKLKDARSQSLSAYLMCLAAIIYSIVIAFEDNSWRSLITQGVNFILTMITVVLIVRYQRVELILNFLGAFLFLKIYFKNEQSRRNEVFF